MTLETKFNMKDLVWCLHEGKAIQKPVSSIQLDIKNGSSSENYFINIGTEKDYKSKIVDVNHLFLTKEELISSLD